MIGDQVLRRLGRVIEVMGAVVVVVMREVGPVQHGVSGIRQATLSRRHTSHGRGLPQHGKRDQRGDEGPEHGRILSVR